MVSFHWLPETLAYWYEMVWIAKNWPFLILKIPFVWFHDHINDHEASL